MCLMILNVQYAWKKLKNQRSYDVVTFFVLIVVMIGSNYKKLALFVKDQFD
jgi:hypothetical protein